MKHLSVFDDTVARAVFARMVEVVATLNILEMAQLKSAYSGNTSFDQLSESLKRKFRDIGIAAVSANALTKKAG